MTLPDGLSPIAAIPTRVSDRAGLGAPRAGLYLTDDRTGDTYLAPAALFARYVNDVIVGTESPRARFWILEPRGNGFAAVPLQNTLAAGTSLEQATFVG